MREMCLALTLESLPGEGGFPSVSCQDRGTVNYRLSCPSLHISVSFRSAVYMEKYRTLPVGEPFFNCPVSVDMYAWPTFLIFQM